MAMTKNIYLQLWYINHVKLQADLEGRLLPYDKPKQAIFFDINCLNSKQFLEKVKSEINSCKKIPCKFYFNFRPVMKNYLNKISTG